MLLRELLDKNTVKDQLNPKIWQKGRLDPEVRQRLIKIARAFEKFVGVELDQTDLTITGSNANYTWTEYSDLDLHIIVRGQPTDPQRELYNAKKALWGEQHDIRIRGLPVECYIQGDEEQHHSTGVYSLARDQWVVKPQRTRPTVDDQAVQAKKQQIMHDIESALLANDLDRLNQVKERITTMRKSGLEKQGEWSVENLVFKILRNLGIIEQITEKIRELEDQELSLEQQ